MAFDRQLSVNAEISVECWFTYFLAEMPQKLVESAWNIANFFKKSQELELNKQLSVNKDISTEYISSVDSHTSCQDVPKVGRKI